MFGLTTSRRLQEETAALKAQIAKLQDERDTAIDEREAFRESAKTAARMTDGVGLQQLANAAQQRAELDEANDPIVRPRPIHPHTAIARERDRARALDQRLAVLQAAVERCTCGGAA